MQSFYEEQRFHDTYGIEVKENVVELDRKGNEKLGVTLGGGAPHCPSIYVTSIQDNSPAAESNLMPGDEIRGIVGGPNFVGMSRTQAADTIKRLKNKVLQFKVTTIAYKHASIHIIDIWYKSLKHRMIDSISCQTSDVLGFSRAVLINDPLVKHNQELQQLERFYQNLHAYIVRLIHKNTAYLNTLEKLNYTLSAIGAREQQTEASNAISHYASIHHKLAFPVKELLLKLKRVQSAVVSFKTKIIKDTRITIGKYADAKYEYLSLCLKVKEMEDEELVANSFHDPLYRTETGNYPLRLILRSRHELKFVFRAKRNDVLVKLDLLNNKHTQDMCTNFKMLVSALSEQSEKSHQIFKSIPNLFPFQTTIVEYGKDFLCNYTEESCSEDEISSEKLSNGIPSFIDTQQEKIIDLD